MSEWSGSMSSCARCSQTAPPFAAESPWMSTPLTIGIDPVIMNLSFSSRSDAAIKAIEELVSGVPPGHLGSAVPGRPSAGA